MRPRALVHAVAVGVLAVVLPRTAATTAPPPAYTPPVDAPVVDPFRPPAGPYAPGNRGLEYGTEPGTPVRAAAGGVVTFAGVVAGTRHVTVLHPDGLRTSYSFLARIDVVVGQRVDQGDTVGTTGGHLHLGARRGDAYLDPASLFAAAPRVRLVPFDDPPGPGPAGERSALRQLMGGIGGLAGRALDWAGDGAAAAADWLREDGSQLLRTALHYLGQAAPGTAELHVLRRALAAGSRAWARARRDCTPADTPVPPPSGRRVAVLVGGLGSSSSDAAIDELDTHALGYVASDVVRFSYAGDRIPDPRDGFAGIPASRYDAADTQTDLRAAGVALADLVEAVASAAPGAPVDVVAHSQGGLVTRLALVELERRHGVLWLRRLGLVATIGTPHGGADLATAVHAIGSTATGSRVFDLVGPLVGLDDDAPAIAQLAETSALVAELDRTPLPPTVEVLSIGARGDLVVPTPRTSLDGARHVVVPLAGPAAHDQLPASSEVTRELALALAGEPPGCQSLRAALVDELVGEGVSAVEDSLGALGWLVTLPPVPVGG